MIISVGIGCPDMFSAVMICLIQSAEAMHHLAVLLLPAVDLSEMFIAAVVTVGIQYATAGSFLENKLPDNNPRLFRSGILSYSYAATP